jgi:hypothetical protein
MCFVRKATFRALTIPIVSAIFILGWCGNSLAITFTTLEFPGATYTELSSIDGNNIVGSYSDTFGAQHGFLFDGVNWTTLDVPFPRSPEAPFLLAYDTRAYGISGNNIVGWYLEGPHGFLFDGTTWTPLDYPGSVNGSNQAVDGNNIVGLAGSTGFLYDGATWTPLAYPGSTFTNPLGIDDGKVVGFYELGDFPAPRHGFVYDGVDWDALNYPGSLATEAHGIDGNRIVGSWSDANVFHGFIYDGLTWTSLDYPDSLATVVNDISGNRLVGTYFDPTGYPHPFLATIPEPTAAILCVAFAPLLLRRRPR